MTNARKIFVNGRFLTQKLTGVQRYAFQIVKRLVEQGFDMHIVMPARAIESHYDTANWPILKCGKYSGHLWEQIELPLFLSGFKKKSNCEVLLLNLCNAAPLFVKNNIVVLHDISYLRNPSWFKKRYVLYYKTMVPRILKRARVVVTVSEFSRSEIVKEYPFTRNKIEVVYNAASQLPVSSSAKEEDVLVEYGLDSGNYILSVSSIDPRKNISNLVKAYKLSHHKGLKFALTGSTGNAFNATDILIEDTTGIMLLGYVDDRKLRALYKHAMCFVYVSFYEGFGLPPVEAMLNECPVIVSEIPSLKEVCADAALYANPHDPSDISRKIEMLRSDGGLRKELIRKGLHRMNHFSWDSSAEKMRDIVIRHSRD